MNQRGQTALFACPPGPVRYPVLVYIADTVMKKLRMNLREKVTGSQVDYSAALSLVL